MKHTNASIKINQKINKKEKLKLVKTLLLQITINVVLFPSCFFSVVLDMPTQSQGHTIFLDTGYFPMLNYYLNHLYLNSIYIRYLFICNINKHLNYKW